MSQLACVVCFRTPRHESCRFATCGQCCPDLQIAQGIVCPAHPSSELSDGRSSGSSDVAPVPRRPTSVTFPKGARQLDVTSPFMVFDPHSLINFELKTGRAVEVFSAKLDQLSMMVYAKPATKVWNKGKKGKNKGHQKAAPQRSSSFGAGLVEVRDLYECRTHLDTITVVLRDFVDVDAAVRLLTVPCTRMYLLMVLKRDGGVKMVQSFEDAVHVDALPDHLRRHTRMARRGEKAKDSPVKKTKGDKARVKRRREAELESDDTDSTPASSSDDESGGGSDDDVMRPPPKKKPRRRASKKADGAGKKPKAVKDVTAHKPRKDRQRRPSGVTQIRDTDGAGGTSQDNPVVVAAPQTQPSAAGAAAAAATAPPHDAVPGNGTRPPRGARGGGLRG
jgi:hypothetical protein